MRFYQRAQSYSLEELELTPRSAMWLGTLPCLHKPPAYFCTQEFKTMIIPLLPLSPSSFLLLIYILQNDEIIQYIIPKQLCCLKKKLGME